MAGAQPMVLREQATGGLLGALFAEPRVQSVIPEELIVKPDMVLPGRAGVKQDPIEAVATVRCLRRNVAAVAGIAFLPGVQPDECASTRLNAMNSYAAPDDHLP